MIVVSNSYSANVRVAIEVATALYKVGVQLLSMTQKNSKESCVKRIMCGWFPAPITTIWAIRKRVPSTSCRGNMNARAMTTRL